MSASTMTTTSSNGRELSRLLTAAVVNKRFCALLLSNPAIALANGYNGESFHLKKEEKDLILTIRARTLEEFASQIIDKTAPNCYSRGSKQIYTQPASPVSYAYCD